MSTAAIPLTSLAHGAGCGCKLPAASLLEIVRDLPAATDERLLVGSATADDAAVFRLADGLALVQTLDFFTPIVDDPYDFGRIAAANALSDVYAMGGTPLTAMNIVAFPLERLGGDVLREILRGGVDVVSGAGATVVGGHSIDDPEPKYGLAVTGVVNPDAMLTNAGAVTGDALVLTKPLGVGAVTTARKRGISDDPELLERAVEVMTALNGPAAEAARSAGAHAVTDVTGFGLLGHLHNVVRASGVAAVIDARDVPAIEGVLELLALDDAPAVSGGSRRNREYAASFTVFDEGVSEARAILVCDATTSGGLLVAVDPGRADEIPGTIVGRVVTGEPGTIAVQ
ncbi:MAG TPA: selenide, water dikinase SelD [Solirubrobacteraceae bacterium]|nr:selenide, water dikinase SelD [Solirubrobacteraceae bacterium]